MPNDVLPRCEAVPRVGQLSQLFGAVARVDALVGELHLRLEPALVPCPDLAKAAASKPGSQLGELVVLIGNVGDRVRCLIDALDL